MSEPMTDIITSTFEAIIAQENFDIACECTWHGHSDHPAEWIVVMDRACCNAPKTAMWCDDCLKEVVAYGGAWFCDKCLAPHPDSSPRDFIVSYDRIRRAA